MKKQEKQSLMAMVESAIGQLSYNNEIGNVVLSLIEKIKNNEVNRKNWEFNSIDNLTIYIKGSAKKKISKKIFQFINGSYLFH